MSHTSVVLICVALAAAAGCRQADGEVPAPVGEQQNKVQDLARDLQHIADHEPDAEKDFIEDVMGLDAKPRPEPVVRDIATSLSAALGGKPLPMPKAQPIADALFTIAVSHQASQRQIQLNGGILRQRLAEAGVETAAADRVTVAADTLSNAVTENRKRWYHVF